MLYREAGQFKTTYGADQAVFPIRQDRIGIAIIMLVAFVLVPLLASSFVRIPWLYNYNVSGAIEVPTRTMLGVAVTGPNATPLTRYLVVLSIVALMTWVASNLLRGRIGRTWMAVRDMDIAAELIGIRLYSAKLLAFAVSSFYCGVAGAIMVFLWFGAAEADSFNIDQSFLILFMVIDGGLGSLIGSFFGAIF